MPSVPKREVDLDRTGALEAEVDEGWKQRHGLEDGSLIVGGDWRRLAVGDRSHRDVVVEGQAAVVDRRRSCACMCCAHCGRATVTM
jgi:hypothetical protein